MKKIEIDPKLYLKRLKLISETKKSRVYSDGKGNIIKIFNPIIMEILKSIGDDKEKKVLLAKPMDNVKEILIPNAAIYDYNDKFLGYRMQEANGIDYNTFDLSRSYQDIRDLHKFSAQHLKLEDIVKRAHKENIVIPDLCTFDNIYIDEKGNLQFIDYDGLQIGDQIASSISTSLGDDNIYMTPKYFDEETKLFTKNLDIKSLIYAYFLLCFNVRLDRVGMPIPGTNEVITLDYIFYQLNLYDDEFCHKVWKCLQDTGENEYIGEDTVRIAENYKMKAERYENTSLHIKSLVRK